METDTFDIFTGFPGRSTSSWAEAVIGIDRALARMQEIAATNPGDYFIYSARNGSILGRINNGHLRAQPELASSKRKATAA
jgi:hypothetical protein